MEVKGGQSGAGRDERRRWYESYPPPSWQEEATQEEEHRKELEAQEKHKKLFEGLKFFLNREVPREALAFIIRWGPVTETLGNVSVGVEWEIWQFHLSPLTQKEAPGVGRAQVGVRQVDYGLPNSVPIGVLGVTCPGISLSALEPLTMSRTPASPTRLLTDQGSRPPSLAGWSSGPSIPSKLGAGGRSWAQGLRASDCLVTLICHHLAPGTTCNPSGCLTR